MNTKSLILALFLSLVVAHAGFAQKRTIEQRTPVDSTTTIVVTETEDITPRHRVFIVNPLRFFAFYNLAYYQRVAPNLAVGAGVQVPAFDEIDGVIVQGEVRFYPKKVALKGFYIAPNLWLDTLDEDDEDVRDTQLELGIVAGWQWFASRDFAIGFGLGAAFELTNDKDLELYNGHRPVLRFNIGYGF